MSSDQRGCAVRRVYLCLLFLPVERERVLTQELLQEPYLFAEELVQGRLILDSTELAGALGISRAWLKLTIPHLRLGAAPGRVIILTAGWKADVPNNLYYYHQDGPG